MRDDDDRPFPPGVVPGAVGAIGALAALVLLAGLIFGALLALCDRREPVQMIPEPAVSSTATASAQATASQSVRVTVRRPRANYPEFPERSPGKGLEFETFKSPEFEGIRTASQPDEIVIEVSQTLTAAATSSAGASASVADDTTGRGKLAPAPSTGPDYGRMGVAALTMPGILAADLQLVRLDVSPVTRWLVATPLEVGIDVAGNLEAGAVGVSAGGKAFAFAGGWSRWNMTEQGLALGVGLRF